MGNSWNTMMDPRFGRAGHFLIYDEEKDELNHFDNHEATQDAHGAGPKTAQKLYEYRPDVLVTGNGPGNNAATILKKTGMKIYIGAGEMTVRQAYEAYQKKKLKLFE